MPDPRTLAASYGLSVELADLGAGTGAALISEYDPDARAIRVNERALDAYRRRCGELSSCDVRTFIDLAVAHEIYHHRETTGEVPRVSGRAQREAAADAFARAQVAVDARLDAFLRDPADGARTAAQANGAR
jgi:hypothetical protein